MNISNFPITRSSTSEITSKPSLQNNNNNISGINKLNNLNINSDYYPNYQNFNTIDINEENNINFRKKLNFEEDKKYENNITTREESSKIILPPRNASNSSKKENEEKIDKSKNERIMGRSIFSKLSNNQTILNNHNFNSLPNTPANIHKKVSIQTPKIFELLSNININDHRYIDLKEVKNFMTSPLENGVWIRTNIERRTVDSKTTEFYMNLHDNNRILMKVLKKAKKSYRIYVNREGKESADSSELLLGKVKSNFFGTEFNLYDNENFMNEEKEKENKIKEDKNKIERSNLSTITYVRKIKIFNFY